MTSVLSKVFILYTYTHTLSGIMNERKKKDQTQFYWTNKLCEIFSPICHNEKCQKS